MGNVLMCMALRKVWVMKVGSWYGGPDVGGGGMTVVRYTADPNDPESMKGLQEFADFCAKSMQDEIQRVADELYISEKCASDVVYLRKRSRWTPALEKELMRLHAIGQGPNIFEWP